jgi:antitoxin component YwqK of YwqJK toxin-antitoxin module
MIKWLIFPILLCTTFQSFAQKDKVLVYELDQIKGLYYQRNTIDPFTGTAIDEHVNGQKKLNIPIKNGKVDGVAKEWNMNGDKIYEATFENGVQVGTETQWFATGDKKLEINYVNGQPDGVCTEWHKNGQKKSEGLFKNGKEEGEHNWWFSDGQIDQQVFYKNGLADGTIKNWYQGGQLKLESHYTEGKKNGPTIKWYQNGEKKSEEFFKMDQPEAEAHFWSKAGVIQGIQIYENGKLVKDVNYRNGNINIGNGYLQVFNEANSFFTVPVTGGSVRPTERQDIITYIVDGMLLQLFNVSVENFEDAANNINSDEELLEVYKVYETALVRATEPDFKYEFNAELLSLDNGGKILHWYFKSPSSLDKEQKPRTVQEEHYYSMVCNQQILSLYSAITNSDDPVKVKEMLLRIANQVKIYEDRIDLNQLAIDIIDK